MDAAATTVRIGVVGCGLMGSGIAEVAARAGLDVVVLEVSDDAVTAGRSRIETSLAHAVQRQELDASDIGSLLEQIIITTAPTALGDRQIVVEAVPEHEELKIEAFRILDRVVEDDDALLASNTSSIPIMKLAMATGRPQQVIGLHFFNPVPVLPLVEVVPSLVTSDVVVDRATAFAAETLGKHVIRSPDRAGFVVNALLVPYLLAAIRMFESGFATADDIDAGMVQGCAHPMGPLALCDLIGLDTVVAVASSLYEEFKEPLYASPPLLSRMVAAGRLGRKSGRGFFVHGR